MASNKETLSYNLQTAARILDNASELAEMKGWPSMAWDLAVAMVTVQRARAEFNRDAETEKIAATHGVYEL